MYLDLASYVEIKYHMNSTIQISSMPRTATPRTSRRGKEIPSTTPLTARRSVRLQLETPLLAPSYVQKRKKTLPKHRYEIRPFCREPFPYEPAKSDRGWTIFYCNQELCNYSAAVATNFRKHLSTRHGLKIVPTKPELFGAIEQALNQVTPDQAEMNPSQRLRTELTEDALRRAMSLLIVQHSLPLNAVEWPALQALVVLANPEIQEYLITCRRTLTKDIDLAWAGKKTLIKSQLDHARTNINISLDVWTSPNTYLFLGVVAHYVRAQQNRPTASLLSLRRIGGHSGQEQWSALYPVLQEYAIVRKLGCLIGDNAST